MRTSTRARNYKIATVVCTCLTAFCLEWQVFAVPAFAIAAAVLSRFGVRYGADRFQLNVLAVVSLVLAIPILIALPFVLINLPHLSVGGISLSG